MNKKAFITLIIILLVLTGCSKPPTEEEQIRRSDIIIGSRDYVSSIAQSYLLKELLETSGYDVYIDIVEEDELWSKLYDNSINIVNSAWFYETDYYDYKTIEKQVTDIGVNSEYYKKGLIVPSYVQIADISELSFYQNKFNGIVYCLNDAQYLYDISTRVLQDYGIDYFIKEVTIEQLEEIIEDAIEKEEWIVFAGYSPNYIFNKYPLRFLEDYKKEFGNKQEIHTLVNTSFFIKNTNISDILKKFYVYEHELNNLLYSIHENQDKDLEQVVENWLEQHPEIVDRALH